MQVLKQYALLALGMTFIPQVMCEEIFSIHGSGTTNPSKCFWNIMSKIQDQSHAFTRLTYRAVGSGTGQTEFIGVSDDNSQTPNPVNDFGSGDIPLSLDDYKELEDINNSSTVVHLPFVVSGVSFFHSVPGVPQGKGGLNLTSCLLARIFNGDISTWDDEYILAENPNLLSMLPTRDFPITVAHRVEGSSSTKSITQYLNLKCAVHWPADMVNKMGSQITWASGSLSCDSSGEMTSCIRGKEGTIGYIDAGHGWDEGLTEIELQNNDGYFVSSLDSFNSGGTGVAATVAMKDVVSFDESFHDISLLDQTGEDTWPILVMSYVYVRKNINEYVTASNQGLLSIFLQALYEPRYIDECKNFGFTPVPLDVKQKALYSIQNEIAFSTEDPWSFEVGIEKIDGQGAKKISPKRRSYGEYERSKLSGDVNALMTPEETTEETADPLLQIAALSQRIDELELRNAELSNGTTETEDSSDKTALGFAVISFVFWCVAILYFAVTKLFLNM